MTKFGAAALAALVVVVSGSAQDVDSGPKAGEKVTALKAYGLVGPFATRAEADSVFEKLPIWTTRSRPSRAARRGAGTGSKSAKMSSSTMVRPASCASFSRRCAVTGESAAASPQNFDADIGRKIARENARNKIWALEGYLLRSKLAA